MLKNRDIVIFAGDWGWFPSVMERIVEHLLPDNRILWIGSVSMRRPRFRSYDFDRIVRRLGSIFAKLPVPAITGNQPPTISPFIIPFYDVPGVKKINDALLCSIVRKKMSELRFSRAILLSVTPMIVDVIPRLGVHSSHYFCFDDYAEYDGAYACIPDLERRLLKIVNSSFALSEPLQKTRIAASGENHYIPMGVDTELFSPDPDSLMPPELRGIRGPIAGFFGQIGSYVDIELIVQCAETYVETTFVIMGRAHVDISAFKRAQNIMFIGEVAYTDVPKYARCFDVGLNPRVINKLSIAMNPLKILEYLAIGMPVVSTDIPAVRTFSDVVHIASTREQFVQLLGQSLKDRDKHGRTARRAIAERYSWKSITSRVTDVIERIDATSLSGPVAKDSSIP